MGGEWRETPLANVALISSGKRPPRVVKEATPDCQIPVIGGGGHSGYTDSALFDGEILITGRVGTLGKLFAPSGPSWPSDNALVIRPKGEETPPRFLRYALQQVIAEAANMNRGAANPLITQGDLGRLIISLPPIPEQRAIAHILGTLDDKIELNRRMSETLEQMARALFKSWFVDFDPVRAKIEGHWRRGESLPGLPAHLYDLFPDRLVDSDLGEIPEGWEVARLSDLCSTQYGYTASALSEPVGPKLLRVTDINKRNWIEWDTVPYCSISVEDKAKYALSLGDIVVARMADPGKSAIVEEQIDAVFASYLVRLKTTSLAHAYYLYGFLKSDAYREYSESATSGSVQANMNAKVIVGAKLLVPPTAVMEAYLHSVLPLRRRIVANLRESRTLTALRDALLPKLISGELRVKDVERFLKERGL